MVKNWRRLGLIVAAALMLSSISPVEAAMVTARTALPANTGEVMSACYCTSYSPQSRTLGRDESSALAQIQESQKSGLQTDATSCQDNDCEAPGKTTGPTRQKALRIISIPVSQTAFDHRWSRVRTAPPSNLMRAELARAGVYDGMAPKDILRLVNEHVNRDMTYVSDGSSYARQDYWAKPTETLAKRAGDCEDLAILKMHLLRAAGYPADKIRFVLARDLAANQDHAFLVVFTPAGSRVLDNTVDRVFSVTEAVALRPIMSFSENNRWIHAIRNDT
jgi:predicted transglutaminase-like cysteine proteinase